MADHMPGSAPGAKPRAAWLALTSGSAAIWWPSTTSPTRSAEASYGNCGLRLRAQILIPVLCSIATMLD